MWDTSETRRNRPTFNAVDRTVKITRRGSRLVFEVAICVEKSRKQMKIDSEQRSSYITQKHVIANSGCFTADPEDRIAIRSKLINEGKRLEGQQHSKNHPRAWPASNSTPSHTSNSIQAVKLLRFITNCTLIDFYLRKG